MAHRRAVVGALAASLVTVVMPALAQARVHRIGIVRPTGPMDLDAGIPQALRTLGYVEGTNIRIDRRYADGYPDRMETLVRDLVASKPDLIVTVAASATRAALAATSTIPLVMFGNFDPVAYGFAKSLARPGRNLTGVLIAPDGTLAAKKLELLKAAVPTATRFALLAPQDAGVGQQVEEVRRAAATLNLQLSVVEVVGADYPAAFAAIAAGGAQALYVTSTTYFLRDRKEIVALANRYRLPASYEWREQVADGGLMTYATSLSALYRRVASYVDRILNGAKAGELPIEQPAKFELVINLKTARAIGLAIPQSLLLRADEIIE